MLSVTTKGTPIMTAKINFFGAAPELMKEWQKAMTHLAALASFDSTLTELVKIRASQINGCANCLNLHVVEAREKGETQQRIDLLCAWRDAPCYSDRERAALAWTDALTRLSQGSEHANAYERLKEHFTDEQQVKLTTTINIINSYNRIAVGFGLFMDAAAIKAARRAVA